MERKYISNAEISFVGKKMPACVYVDFCVKEFHRFHQILKKSGEWKMFLNNWSVGKLF